MIHTWKRLQTTACITSETRNGCPSGRTGSARWHSTRGRAQHGAALHARHAMHGMVPVARHAQHGTHMARRAMPGVPRCACHGVQSRAMRARGEPAQGALPTTQPRASGPLGRSGRFRGHGEALLRPPLRPWTQPRRCLWRGPPRAPAAWRAAPSPAPAAARPAWPTWKTSLPSLTLPAG